MAASVEVHIRRSVRIDDRAIRAMGEAVREAIEEASRRLGEVLREWAYSFERGLQSGQSNPAKHPGERRAREYLIAHLSHGQRGCLKRNGYFTVRAKSGQRYRISVGALAYNVDALDEKSQVIATYCAVPVGRGLPPSDVYLAQKFWLETDEAGFLRVANRSSY